MKSVLQLVSSAKIVIQDRLHAKIADGLLVFIGFEKNDQMTDVEKLIERILNFRIFPDEHGKMNKNLQDIDGSLLLVPQFTLVAETKKGTRPGFSLGMPPENGRDLFENLRMYAKKRYTKTSFGAFGANMSISLCNEGPVTFLMETSPK